MTLEEKKAELIAKYIPLLIENGMINPQISIDINLTKEFDANCVHITYDTLEKNSRNYNKTYVNNSAILTIQYDFMSKIFNELFNFMHNKNI